MKFLAIVAATMLTASSLVPAVADAAPRHHRGWKTKKVCTTKWKHGKRWRQCRNVRVRW